MYGIIVRTKLTTTELLLKRNLKLSLQIGTKPCRIFRQIGQFNGWVACLQAMFLLVQSSLLKNKEFLLIWNKFWSTIIIEKLIGTFLFFLSLRYTNRLGGGGVIARAKIRRKIIQK